MDTAVNVLIGLMLAVLVGACALGWIAWRNVKREEDATAEAARRSGNGGGGGPEEKA